jgi:hypothetical protein
MQYLLRCARLQFCVHGTSDLVTLAQRQTFHSAAAQVQLNNYVLTFTII